MNNDEILCRVESAIKKLFERDSVLFDLGTNGISEQSITFRLGFYLQRLFPQCHVDCEYNREGTNLKTDENVDQEWMKPDVIIHKRKERDQNLVVIEAKKKQFWSQGWDEIEQKLKAFTHTPGKYEYRFGIAWRIATSQRPATHTLVWFWRGSELCRTSVSSFKNEVLRKISMSEEVGCGD